MDGKRTEAFSDAVFAVAITLLVLDLRVPAGERPLLDRMLDIWPSYLAYFVSFLTIGIMWLNHHTLFRHVERVDRPLLLFNLALLMAVALVPFPTALLGEELGRHLHGADAKTVAVAYGLVMILMSIGFSGLWWWLVLHPDLLNERLPAHAVRRSVPRFAFGFAVYVVATAIGLAQPLVSIVLYGLMAVYYAFEHLPEPVPS